ncbi:MAG: glycosyltransferase [Candidatus Methylacidiphilales bacterium]|nr:glycosyltransferase [Candidatus Methylacidiphilales bacterium]
MDKSLVVSVVVPLRNGAEILPAFLGELAGVLKEAYYFYEIILVDDGSTDRTPRVVAELLRVQERVRFLQLSRPYGREIATAAGLETAIGDFVVVMDALTDPPAMIPDLVARCRLGSGVLCGISSEPEKSGLLTAWATRLFHTYCRKVLDIDYRENSTDFRVLSRQAVNAVTRIRDRRRYLRIFAATLGYQQECFTYQPRTAVNQSRGGLQERVEHAIEIVIAQSRHPLRVVSRLGLLMSVLNVLYAGYIVAIYFLKPDVARGWTTLSMQMTGMFFFLFLILAVLCEYVGRILEETQERPLYYVAAEQTSSVLLETSIEKNILNEAKAI